MDNTVVKIKEASYSIGRLSCKKQFAVARRLGPFIGDVVPSIRQLVDRKTPFLDRAVVLVPTIVKTLANLKDEDCDFIFDSCLVVVKVQKPEGWFPLTTPDGGTIMYPDLVKLPDMLQITAEVVKANLLDFFTIEQLMGYVDKLAADENSLT